MPSLAADGVSTEVARPPQSCAAKKAISSEHRGVSVTQVAQIATIFPPRFCKIFKQTQKIDSRSIKTTTYACANTVPVPVGFI
jgi:hypothetical protein